MSDVVYLYGFVPADTALTGVPAGVDERPVRGEPAAGVLALVSELPADTYAADALDDRLRDLDWVAARGLAHERVVAWAVDHSEIVPAPLFTLFSSLDALRGNAEQRAADIAGTLERFRGLREWDVKLAYRADVLAQNAAAVSDAVRDVDREIAAATPGRRFLLERKRNELLKTEVAGAAHRIASQLFERLQAQARAGVRLQLPATGAELPVVLSAALLVPRSDESRIVDVLTAERDELRPLGFELSFSGPWAAYRFMDETGDGRAGSLHAGGATRE